MSTGDHRDPQKNRCPKCGSSDLKRWGLPNLMMIHWILNPGLCINEVVLGQRLPKLTISCNECTGTLIERTYVPCPSCGANHIGRFRKKRQALGNWRGYQCAACKKPIPALWNVFSLLLLAVTSPLWFPPYHIYFKDLPRREYPLYGSPEAQTPPPVTKATFVKMAVFFGSVMWVLMSLFQGFQRGGFDLESVKQAALTGFPLWLGAGALFGFVMWVFLGRNKE